MRKITIVLTLFAAALALPLQAGVTLEGATDALELVTSSTSAIDYTCSWSNVTATALTTPGTTKGNIAAATTTTVIAAPAASNFRHVRKCWFHNDAGGSSNTLTVQIDVSATNRLLYAATLLAGEALSLTEDGDFILYDSTGQKKSLLVTGGGTEATALRVTVANDSTGVLSVDDNGSSLTVDASNLDVQIGGSDTVTVSATNLDVQIGGSDTVTVSDGAGAMNVIVDSGAVTVSDGAGALNVIVDSSALPSGAATSALQTQPGVDIGDVTINNAGGGAAVNIQDGGNVITVDGAVTVSGSVTASDPSYTDATGGAVPANAAFVAGTDGTNTTAIKTDAGGELQVDVLSSALPSGAATSALQDGIIKDGAGDTTQANVASGKLSVDPGTVTVTDGAGALNVIVDSATLGTVTVSDGAGAMNTIIDSGSVTVSDGAGALNVIVDSATLGTVTVSDGAGAMNTIVDSGTLTAVTTITNPVQLSDGVDTATVRDLAANDSLNVAIVDGAGDQITSFGGGTQYTEDAAAAADPVGTAPILVRKDTPATTVTTDGDNIAQRGTNYGAAYVTVLTAAGAEASFGGGTQYDEDTAAGAADKVTMAGAVRKDTAAALVDTDGDRTELQTDSIGRLRTEITPLPIATSNNDGTCTDITVSATILASFATRRGAVIMNRCDPAKCSATTLYIKLGATAATTDFPLAPGDKFVLQGPAVYTGEIAAISDTGTTTVCALEF